LVRFGFGFINKKPNRTETEKTEKKTEPNQKNQAKLKNRAKTGKNQAKTELNRKNQDKLV